MALEASGLLPASGVGISSTSAPLRPSRSAPPPLRASFRGAKEWFDKKKHSPRRGVARIAAHRMERLMDRDDNRLDIVALIATLLLSLCLWPMIWELTRAILQHL